MPDQPGANICAPRFAGIPSVEDRFATRWPARRMARQMLIHHRQALGEADRMANRFIRRLVGAAMFDAATYEDVEADRAATPQALAIILFSSLAAGIGARGSSG